MKVLFLSQVVPFPLDAGPKVRAYFVLRHLAAAGHAVTLLTFRRASDTPAALDHLRGLCADVQTVPMPRSRARDAAALARSLLAGPPWLIARDRVPAMSRAGADLARDLAPDVVHADQLWMAPYALAAAGAAPRRPLRVLDQHNAVYLVPRRLAEGVTDPVRRALLRREATAMARYEVDTCRRFDQVVWVTDADRAAFDIAWQAAGGRARAPMPPFTTIPICVDPTAVPPIPRRPGARRVTFLGGMHWPPNAEGIAWFARDVWPRVRAAVPDAVLTVIGRQPPAGLAAASGLEIAGYVADPAPYLAETAAFIVPLHSGGGMRVKIADAWCQGLPVVTTAIGCEGMAVRDGENALLADSPGAFADAVVRVLRDPALADQLARAGRATVEARYDWRLVYRDWDGVYLVPTDRTLGV